MIVFQRAYSVVVDEEGWKKEREREGKGERQRERVRETEKSGGKKLSEIYY